MEDGNKITLLTNAVIRVAFVYASTLYLVSIFLIVLILPQLECHHPLTLIYQSFVHRRTTIEFVER